MKVCTLTRISSLAPEICPNILLTGDVFYTERYNVFLHLHGPTEQFNKTSDIYFICTFQLNSE